MALKWPEVRSPKESLYTLKPIIVEANWHQTSDGEDSREAYDIYELGKQHFFGVVEDIGLSNDKQEATIMFKDKVITVRNINRIVEEKEEL